MNELQTISQLFQNRLFRIPDYQRGYAWKGEQLADFWDDLSNLQMDRYHYTGLISLRQLSTKEVLSWENDAWLIESGYRPCHVVDGQQRLTTIAVLMNELICFVRELSENVGQNDGDIVLGYETLKDIYAKYIARKRPPQYIITSYLFGYETDNPSADYLQYRVFNEPFSGTVEETYYTKNLKYAKTFFNQRLVELYAEAGLTGLAVIYKKLTQKLMFNIHEIEDDYDVFVAFETMNNRGKPLTNLELLKNRLIYLTTLFDNNVLDETDKTALRKQINDTWKEVYYQLGRNRSTSLSDDEFLRAHWIIFFQYSRQKGTDYIKFLLGRFSAKNIYEKQVAISADFEEEPVIDDCPDEDEDVALDDVVVSVLTTKLQPKEIDAYVRSLKETAKYWYYTHFPQESELSNEEIRWLDRLNRIGIGYFRPLVAASLTPSANIPVNDRIELFKAIERFIFICFRMGMFQASYQSSIYNRRAKDIYFGKGNALEIANELNSTTTNDSKASLANFKTRIDKRFSDGDGFYGLRDLRYLLFEYESALSDQNKIQKVDWSMFSKVEKDKITIEHILPQTPTKWYWRNQFRSFNDDEIKILSNSLGNLLPLAQSINSGLQNDSFQDKRTASTSGRRGYENGSHSEIEVSKEIDWNAVGILQRGKMLLSFMENRWAFTFANDEERLELLHLQFLQKIRENIPEIEEPSLSSSSILRSTVPAKETASEPVPERRIRRASFWNKFVDYCNGIGRADICVRKPSGDNWYDVPIHSNEYHIFFNLIGKDTLRVGIYVYDSTTFERLECKKTAIETFCGFSLDWYSSKKSSVAKRILFSVHTNIYAEDNLTYCFGWLISHFDSIHQALLACDFCKVDNAQPHVKKETGGALTNEMAATAYYVAKKVYAGELGRGDGKDEIVKLCGMNAGSAGDYITDFLAMIEGSQYTRTMNEYSTQFFLEHIEKDYGIDILKRAISACEQHAKYYATLGHGRLAYIERIVQKYRFRSDLTNGQDANLNAGKLVKQLLATASTSISDFQLKLEKLGWFRTDYGKYMTTAPIEVDTELKRLTAANFDLSCALLTMLLREDHFSNGAFDTRLSDGSVEAVLRQVSSLSSQES